MRIKTLFGTIGIIVLLFSFSFIFPILVGLWYKEGGWYLIKGYGLPMAITMTMGGTMWYLGLDYVENVRPREAVVAVSAGWLLIAFLGALPYLLTGTLTSMVDAWFESMSGFATCGSTVIIPPTAAGLDYLDVYTHSIFFWRALTQWLGGMGMIVLSVVILARIMGGSMFLFRAEASGDTVIRIKPKIQQTARILWGIYAFLTFLMVGLLMLCGVNPYDAVCHSFTTLATGGFSPHGASIGYYNSPLIEGVVAFFIIIGATDFVLHYRLMHGDVKSLAKDAQLRMFLVILGLSTLVIMIVLYQQNYYTFTDSFRYAAFQVITMNACAGFVTADYTTWPASTQYLLVVLMLIGGCVGSTAGAIKISRILIMFKVVRREIHKVLHPRAVLPIRLGKSVISEQVVQRVGVFIFAYLGIFLICTVLFLFLSPTIATGGATEAMSIGESASAVATTMGGVGPGLGNLAAHMAGVSASGKILLTMCMWLGRLEIFSALILFFPSTYKS